MTVRHYCEKILVYLSVRIWDLLGSAFPHKNKPKELSMLTDSSCSALASHSSLKQNECCGDLTTKGTSHQTTTEEELSTVKKKSRPQDRM